MRSPERLLELAEELYRPMERYLKWKQICERYERGRHTVFSDCFLDAVGTTAKEREAKAYCDRRYSQYLEEWDKAEKECVKARVEYENLKTNFDAWQSALSFDRESFKRLAG